jgi:glycogen synthase
VNHVIVCREYPPARTPPGGIGTYVMNISRLLAEAGETVHVVTERWAGAPRAVEERCGGRLIIHRVPLDGSAAGDTLAQRDRLARREAEAFARSDFPVQYFSLQAALLIERLVVREAIDVIEAQEWEAPLYYFQLRRALGLGPTRCPPCIVHLHSPTEFLFQHNEWDLGRPDYLPTKRLEDYSIGAADALLCPSHYLAAQASAHYGVATDAIEVIPCPLGAFTTLDRSPDVWATGPICYVGRLEPRKGVIEWVEAAVSLAQTDANVVFEFIGADLPYTAATSVRGHLDTIIPAPLKSRFVFHGSQPHHALPRYLARARAAVVPSRWENYPNTCIEAMSTGLPVIASRDGGMVEMIDDGRTGWLAPVRGAVGLADALARALAASPARRAAMGEAAAATVRRLCDANRIVERQIALRRRVADRGATASLRLPANLPWARRAITDTSARRTAAGSSEGLAVVVTCLDGDHATLAACLATVHRQRTRPAAVAVVVTPRDSQAGEIEALRRTGVLVCEHRGGTRAMARNAGAAAVIERGHRPLGFVFLEPADRLAEDFIGSGESVLRACSEVGLVSCWTAPTMPDGRWEIHPCPALPYGLLRSETVPGTVVRTEALNEAGLFRPEMPSGYDDWDLSVAVMAAGWTAVTYPATLATRSTEATSLADTPEPARGRLRRSLLTRFSREAARDAEVLVLLAEAGYASARRPVSASARQSHPPGLAEILRRSRAEQMATLRRAWRRPCVAARWLAALAWYALRRTGVRLRPDPLRRS